jgi:tetratricopeptide (TPR) repeat protein
MRGIAGTAGVLWLAVSASCGGPAPEKERAASFLRGGEALKEAGAAWESGALTRAAALYEEGLRERPAASCEAYLRLAGIRGAGGRSADALDWLKRGRAQFPDHPPLLLRLGAFHERNGRLAAALECYEEARARTPDDPFAWAAVERTQEAMWLAAGAAKRTEERAPGRGTP